MVALDALRSARYGLVPRVRSLPCLHGLLSRRRSALTIKLAKRDQGT
jgi:hypothetical protein